MKNFIPEDRINHIAPLFTNLVKDSMYLHALAVKEDLPCSKSVGTLLILKVMEYARELGIDKLSAHVWSNNSRVLKVLLKKGFEVYDRISLPDHPLLPDRNEMYLLTYTIK
jgi:ribosomal protein S18 acetylase RimI-like enzyme